MKHYWWHWLFEFSLGIPYRFVPKWHGTVVEYRDISCTLCKRIVRQRYKQEV